MYMERYKKIKDIRKKQRINLIKCLMEHYGIFYAFFDVLINNPDNDIFDEELEKITKKIWEQELLSGNYTVISWNKSNRLPDRKSITYATISKSDDIVRFCKSDNGIELDITFESLIGAINKDGATLLEEKENDYTIGKIDGKYINSYNGATKLITPYQLVNLDQSGYYYLYNELILDSKKVSVKGPITLIEEEDDFLYLR